MSGTVHVLSFPEKLTVNSFTKNFTQLKQMKGTIKWVHLKMKRTELGMCSSATQTGRACDSKNKSVILPQNERRMNGNERF